MAELERLKKLLGGPEFEWIVQKLRKKLERGEECQGTLRLTDPSPAQREALSRLLGRKPSTANPLSFELSQLEQILQAAGLATDWKDAVESLSGSWINRVEEKARVQSNWEAIFDLPEASRRDLSLESWLKQIQKSGLLKKLSKNDLTQARELLTLAARVLQSLPQNGISLSQLSAQLTGNSHALDEGSPLSTLVLKGIPASELPPSERASETRRNLWDSQGVVMDDVSAPVLVLNLRALDHSLTGRILNLSAEAGEPVRLTLRQLLKHPPSFSRSTLGGCVFVCENPSLVSTMADRLGPKCAPMICLDGQPKTTAHVLLRLLKNEIGFPEGSGGVQIYYHGDYDWDGLKIGNLMVRSHGVKSWRYSASHYLSHLKTLDQRVAPMTRLTGTPVEALWDHELGSAMCQAGRFVHEESVLDELMEDLDCGAK